MTRASDIMHPGAACVGEHETLASAARIMRERDVGALPICGERQKLLGIVTDRDIVLKCVAEGRDPEQVTAGEIAQGLLDDGGGGRGRRAGAADDGAVPGAPASVINHPEHEVVGMISEADIARGLPQARLAEFVSAVCAEEPPRSTEVQEPQAV